MAASVSFWGERRVKSKLMFRLISILIAAIAMITLLRTVIGSAAKLMGFLFTASNQKQASQVPPRPGEPLAQILRRCTQCGTFKPDSTAIRVGNADNPIYFCSSECLKKNAAKAS